MKSASRFRRATLGVCLTLGAACGGSPGTPSPNQTQPPVPTVISVSLLGANASIQIVGQTLSLKVIETLSDSSTRDISATCSFESSNTSVATANSSGLVTAWATGVTTMTAVQLESGTQNTVASGTVSVLNGPVPDPSEIPTLLSPDEGAVLTAAPSGVATFNWSAVPGATAYHLNIQHTGSMFPALDKADIANPPWQIATGGIDRPNFAGWHWSVQARVGGIYQPWSSVRAFSYTAASREASAPVGSGWWLSAPVSSTRPAQSTRVP